MKLVANNHTATFPWAGVLLMIAVLLDAIINNP